MQSRSWTFLSCTAWGAVAALVLGCAAKDDELLPAADLEEEGGELEGTTESCEPGEQDECSITLAEHNGVLSCFYGTKVCNRKGKWGGCTSGEIVSLPAMPEGSSARQLLALTDTSDCDSNPCDPRCRAFPELPEGAGEDSLIVLTSPFEWESGSLSNYPQSIIDRGLSEPCATGSDCQFNTYCANPVSTECTHDKCETGDGLLSSCDPCVEDICEMYPECCAGYTGECTHDLGVTGEALIETCSDCTTAICNTSGFEYCCDREDGAWDAACVAEVENTCGGDYVCCSGETEYMDSCYKVNTTNATWTSARSSCQAIRSGWDLASIESSGENSFAYSLNSSNETWIGLTSGNGISTGDNWKWSNGDPSGTWKESTRSGHPFNAFVSGEPNDGEECARIRLNEGGVWYGIGCSSSYDSLCEGPAGCEETTTTEAAPACAHDPCQVGAALKSNCDTCVQAVCAANSTCCDESTGTWSATCVGLVATQCTATCNCASGESSYGGHCYKVNTTNATWANAVTNCRNTANRLNWDLVSIGSSGENTFVYNLNSSQDTWIGFTELNAYGGNTSQERWAWTNGSPSGTWRESNGTGGITFVSWSSGEPNDSGNCARLMPSSSGKWGDASCTSSYDYICEGPTGSVLSPVTPVMVQVTTLTPGTFISQEFEGTGEDLSEWSDECVDRVASMCDADCDVPDDQGSGICVPWYPGQTDDSCGGIDLAVGVPCNGSIPVCNHGTETAPAGIRLVHFPENSGQFPSCTPNLSTTGMAECFTPEEIPPGDCIDVTTCPNLTGVRDIMVNPPGAAHVDECSCTDNWSIYSAGTCGPPVCSGGTNAATMETRPIDIIVSIDNSFSMQSEIVSIQQRINNDFAEILEDSGIDYRVIMVSRYGNVHTMYYNGGSAYTSAYSICVGSPLSTLSCPTSTLSSTPAVAHNSPKFFHHSTDIGSHDMWCKLTGSFAASDPYPVARTGFTPIATGGWGAYLREDSFKVFVGITDDSPDTNSGATNGNCSTASGFTNNLTGAQNFDQAIRTLSSTHFGAYSAANPNENRNYIWYSIVGMGGNHTTSPTALEPSAATVTKCCKGDGTTINTCQGDNAAVTDAAGNGVGYQELSKMTGGLRYPSCYYNNFDQIFHAIADDVVEEASVSCDFTLQNEGSFDINTAKVYLQEDEDDDPVLLTRAANLAACTATGWYLPNANEPANLSLCPSACTSVQSNEESRLSVEVGCLGTGYDPYSFDETYSAECRFDQNPQWGFLSIDSTTPGDSSITLRARTAESEADLATAEYVDIAVLSTANGNSLCSAPTVTGCPIDMYEALDGAPLAHHAYVQVEVTMTPTSDKSQLPTVDEWSLSYSCVDAE